MKQRDGLRSAQGDACVEQRSKKGQQLLAQGNALGNVEHINSPCKGKRTIAGHRPAIMLLPLRGVGCTHVNTQGVALGY